MRVTVGLDVGGTKILAVAIDPDGSVQATRRSPTPTDDAAHLVSALGDAVDAVVADVVAGSGGAPVELAAIGIGLPGFLSADGVPQQAPNLPVSVGVDVRTPLEARFAVPVVADNDANCAAWAARRTDAPDAESVVAVTLGTGIGGGFVLEGRMLHGAHGFAGEPGHMVVAVDGPLCKCGQHGCWEVFASGTALGRQARAAVEAGRAPGLLAAAGGSVDAVDGPLVGRLAAEGDAGAGAVLDEYAGWIAVGLVNLVNLLDPGVIVIGGGVVALGETLMARVRSAVAGYTTMVEGRSTPIRASSLGPTAGAVGAALLAGERLSGR